MEKKMNFDPSLILECLQSVGPQSALAITSFTSFFLDVRTFFNEKAIANESATVDDYLEWLRRKNHAELVELIGANRELFEHAFSGLQKGILAEFDKLNAKIDQIHNDLTDMNVDPEKIKITPITGWLEESVITINGSPQLTCLCATFALVNQNRTKLTLRNVAGTLVKGLVEFPIKCRIEMIPIAGEGASAAVPLITKKKLMYQKGEKVILNGISLKFDQCEQPLSYQLIDGRFLPVQTL
jgi:hypothetical protein